VDSTVATSLLARYKSRGAILDTNLMLLLIVGTYSIGRIETFKRTLKYTSSDFRLISNMLARMDRRIITPNIFTETDNFCRQLPEKEYDAVSRTMVRLCAEFMEVYTPSRDALSHPLYSRLGITDCITLALASEKHLVITDDFALANRITSMGGDAININHLRRFD